MKQHNKAFTLQDVNCRHCGNHKARVIIYFYGDIVNEIVEYCTPHNYIYSKVGQPEAQQIADGIINAYNEGKK